MIHLRFLIFSFAIFLLPNAAWGQFPDGFGLGMGSAEPGTAGKLEANVNGYSPGKTFQLTFSLQHSRGWHSYYINPGSVGLPPSVRLEAPEGFTIEGPYWSIPELGTMGEEDVYYGSSSPYFVWFVTPGSNEGEAAFTAFGSWQLCGEEGCLPPTDEEGFSLTLPSIENPVYRETGNVPMEPGRDDRFRDWEFQITAGPSQNDIQLSFTPSGEEEDIDNVYFFSNTGEILPTGLQSLEKTEKGYLLFLKKNDGTNDFYPIKEKTGRLAGILSFEKNGRREGILLDLPLGKSSSLSQASYSSLAPEAPQSFFQLLIALFIGGMILNLMPCVFPVIGLKVLGFVELGGGQRRKVVMHSLSFVIGVVASFWALTTILFILKKSVPNINWAFWLESPWVIFSLLLLLLLMGLSMFGVFEFGAAMTGVGANAQRKKGYAGSFYSGILCTVVATPCSAPFLGASLGVAISLPTSLMYLAFTCMGLGMALPYLILGIFPGLVQRLPRPGAWMESFKQGLSFLLFGTAGWLLWTYLVFFSHMDPTSSLIMILGLVVIGFAAWVKGRWDLPYKSKKTRIAAKIIVILVFLAGCAMSSPWKISKTESHSITGSEPGGLIWEDWSPERQQQAIDEGQPVYIDFTARWCFTCIGNKKVAYTEPVMEIFREHNVLMLKGDKTTSNPVIDEELRKLGRSAVPVNVLYVPDDPEPKITTPLLTGGYLESFLKEHLED